MTCMFVESELRRLAPAALTVDANLDGHGSDESRTESARATDGDGTVSGIAVEGEQQSASISFERPCDCRATCLCCVSLVGEIRKQCHAHVSARLGVVNVR